MTEAFSITHAVYRGLWSSDDCLVVIVQWWEHWWLKSVALGLIPYLCTKWWNGEWLNVSVWSQLFCRKASPFQNLGHENYKFRKWTFFSSLLLVTYPIIDFTLCIIAWCCWWSLAISAWYSCPLLSKASWSCSFSWYNLYEKKPLENAEWKLY